MKKRSFKGGIFTFDLCIAIIVFIFIIYYSYLVINSLKEKIDDERKEIMKYKLYLISEKLVKRDIARTDGKVTYSNLFENKNINASKYREFVNYMHISSEFFNMEDGNPESCTDLYCIERLMVVGDEIKAIRICIC
jgi:hypothetical protein